MAVTLNALTTGVGGLQTTGDTSGAIQLQSNGTATLTVDASGNVGIGTASPSGAGRTLAVQGSAAGDNYSSIVAGSASNANFVSFYSGQTADPNPSILFNNSLRFGTATAPTTAGYTERMRIDSVGRPLFNTTSALNAGYMSLLFDGSAYNGFTLKTSYATLGSVYLYFINSAGNVAGFVSQNGTTTVSYTTSSDYRLKENIVPMTGALDKVLQLKPVNYTWKSDGSNGQGFIAHELQAIVPDAVVGEKDAVDDEGNPKYQGVDTSFLVATLTAAIQEQQTIINELKSRIEVLEGAK